jgi:hypothetical protein
MEEWIRAGKQVLLPYKNSKVKGKKTRITTSQSGREETVVHYVELFL